MDKVLDLSNDFSRPPGGGEWPLTDTLCMPSKVFEAGELVATSADKGAESDFIVYVVYVIHRKTSNEG